MSVNVKALAAVERVSAVPEADDAYNLPKGHRVLVSAEPYQDRADGLEDGVYRFYDVFAFEAGSFEGYGHWREQLATMIGYQIADLWNEKTSGPFVELIKFSDSEGFIGPQTAKKLASDFNEWRTKAAEYASKQDIGQFNRETFLSRYDNFLKAFEFAAKSRGVVLFS